MAWDNNEIAFIKEQLIETYKGDPWFGHNAMSLLNEVDEETAFAKLDNQHSILELLWHMITWRELVIDRLQPKKSLSYFEENDWRDLDHGDKTLWKHGLRQLQETQDKIISLLQHADDSLLEQGVKERKYNFRKLLHGVIQHGIYHLGQIAHITKLFKNQ